MEQITENKIQHLFSLKTLTKPRREGNALNLIKGINEKPPANIMFNDERLNAFSLRLGARQGCSLSPFLFKIMPKILGSAVRQEKEIKGIQIRKQEVQLSLLEDNITIYVEYPMESTNKNKS